MLELKTLTDADFIPWLHAEARAYGNRLDHDPAVLRPHFDLARAIAVYDTDGAPADGAPAGGTRGGIRGGPQIVGGAHSHLLEMSVPGGAAPVAGVANVAVQPTHRRRGVMSMMMRHQLHDCHARGEPLAALFASESGIYGRFGYGIGSFHEQWRIDRQHTAYARPAEHARAAAARHIAFIDPARIMDELPEVFRRATAGRPAVFQRARHHWQQAADDPEHQQGGPGGLFYAACRNDDGHIEGYAVYRTRRPVVIVQELMTTTAAAAAALWRFCFDTDLMETTEALKRPVDDPLPWLLADPRRLQRATRDGLWLRIIDAQKALPLRRYAAPGALTLQIHDDLCPWNTTPFTLETTSDADTVAANYATGRNPDTAASADRRPGQRAPDTGAPTDTDAAGYPTDHNPNADVSADANAAGHPTGRAPDTGAPAAGYPAGRNPDTAVPADANAAGYPTSHAPDTGASAAGHPGQSTPDTGASAAGHPGQSAQDTGAPAAGHPGQSTPDTGAPAAGHPGQSAQDTGAPVDRRPASRARNASDTTSRAPDTSAYAAECRPARSAPDVTITVSALASAYLGAATFTTLARAGLAEEHTPGALQKADRMFAVTHQPWTPYNF